jgi:hypothetical protein
MQAVLMPLSARLGFERSTRVTPQVARRMMRAAAVREDLP